MIGIIPFPSTTYHRASRSFLKTKTVVAKGVVVGGGRMAGKYFFSRYASFRCLLTIILYMGSKIKSKMSKQIRISIFRSTKKVVVISENRNT